MTNLSPSVRQAKVRAILYRDVAGISQIFFGIAFAYLGSMDYLKAQLTPVGARLRIMPALGAVLMLGLIIVGKARFMEWMNERVVYPRTGYLIKEGEEERTSATQKGFYYALLTLGLITVFFFLVPAPGRIAEILSIHFAYIRWIFLALLTLAFCSVLISSAEYRDVGYLLSVTPMIAGTAWWTVARPAPPFDSVVAVLGVSWVIGGALRLLVYLVRNPRPKQTEA